MPKFVRQIWAKSNEHIRVRREGNRSNRQPWRFTWWSAPMLLIGAWLGWEILRIVLYILECVAGLLAAVMPWIALIAGIAGILFLACLVSGKGAGVLELFRPGKEHQDKQDRIT